MSNADLILSNVESAISNSIITSTSIFAECTKKRRVSLRSPSATNSPSQSLQNKIIGISSKPNDKAVSKECSFDKLLNGSICTIVEGVLTLYYQEDNTLHTRFEEVEIQIKAIIEGLAGNGNLSQANNTQILRLTYISTPNNMDEGNNMILIPNNMDEGNNMILISIVSSAVIIVSLCLAFVIWKKSRKIQSDDFPVNKPPSNTNWHDKKESNYDGSISIVRKNEGFDYDDSHDPTIFGSIKKHSQHDKKASFRVDITSASDNYVTNSIPMNMNSISQYGVSATDNDFTRYGYATKMNSRTYTNSNQTNSASDDYVTSRKSCIQYCHPISEI